MKIYYINISFECFILHFFSEVFLACHPYCALVGLTGCIETGRAQTQHNGKREGLSA